MKMEAIVRIVQFSSCLLRDQVKILYKKIIERYFRIRQQLMDLTESFKASESVRIINFLPEQKILSPIFN